MRATPYGAFVLAGLVAGWWIARRRAPAEGIDPTHVDRMAPLVVASGLAGAWALARVGGEAAGARALFGALLLPVLAGIAYALAHRLRLGRVGDTYAPAMAVGIAFGRVGCFLAGCCFGAPCDAAWLPRVRFDEGSVAHGHHVALGLVPADAPASLPVHPVQLYEAAGAALLAVAIFLLTKRRRVPGEMFILFGVGYGVLRFALEYLRADPQPAAAGLTLPQWLAAAAVATCLALLAARRRMHSRGGAW